MEISDKTSTTTTSVLNKRKSTVGFEMKRFRKMF